MKLCSLTAKQFRSLHDETFELSDLNLFIGANASGKSTILDALRFLHEGVHARDFRQPVFSRGGIVHLAWKGVVASRVELRISIQGVDKVYDWEVHLIRDGYEFYVEENLYEMPSKGPPPHLLHASRGEGWWWSGEEGARVSLKQAATTCALSAASADASFPARDVAEFVSRWGFFDPQPFVLRRDWTGFEADKFDPYGRNLGTTLYALDKASPESFRRVVEATRSVVGLPNSIEPRESEDRFYFVQDEPGLLYPVHQMGISSGTLRVLALMTALHGQPETTLIGIEEPENYVHPSAVSAFVEHLQGARDRVQFLVTTHSPIMLDLLDDPAAVRVVRRNEGGGTVVSEPPDHKAVRHALDESGFGLGEFYETQGFGR